MKNLGHYYIHHNYPMDIAIELNTILDENNVAQKERYTVSSEFTEWRRVLGMNFYTVIGNMTSFTTGLGYYFTWELMPVPCGHTKQLGTGL